MLTWALGSGSEQATERESVNKVNWRGGGGVKAMGELSLEFGTTVRHNTDDEEQQQWRGLMAVVAAATYTTSNDDCCCDFNYGELANNSSQLKLHCGI